MRAEAWLRGAVRVQVSGALPAAFLNECARRGVELNRTEAADDYTLRTSLLSGDLPLAREAAARSGCEVHVLERRGLPEGARRLRRRLALCAGLMLVMLCLFTSSLFIWDIRVTENATAVPDSRILSVLARQGVGVGSFWPAFTSDMIRSRALPELPGLSWLTVNVRGSRAEVLVRGAVAAPGVRDERDAAEVVAGRAGVITELRVLEGECAVAVGDTVLAGEVLVSGRRESSYGQDRYVHARAEVTARTWYELTAAAPASVGQTAPAGAARSRWGLILGKRRVNFSLFSRIPEGTCDKITSIYPLAVPGVFTLPVSLLRESRQPLREGAVSADREESWTRLETALAEELERRMGEGEVLSSHYVRGVTDGLMTVTLRAECLERIDTERPMTRE